MSEPFVGEIRMFAGNFAPRGWAFCDGALLPVSSNDALFSLIGTTYGGDGRTTFALPDLRGRVPIHDGSGAGLTSRRLGERTGVESVTLQVTQLPAHSHTLSGTASTADQDAPSSSNLLAQSTVTDAYSGSTPDTPLADASITRVGGGQAHGNVMPSLCVNFIIALQGVYPSRS